jgi:hypothetical protein
MDTARSEPRATPTGDRAMEYRDAARAQELHNLRLALATFALQLDAFEMRMRAERLGAGAKPEIPARDAGSTLPKEKMNGGQ